MTDTTTTIENEALAAESYRIAGQACFAVHQGYGVGVIGPLSSDPSISAAHRPPGAGQTLEDTRAFVANIGGSGLVRLARAKPFTDSILVLLAGYVAEQIHRPERKGISPASVRDRSMATEMTTALHDVTAHDDDRAPRPDWEAILTESMGNPGSRLWVKRVADQLAAGRAVTTAQIRKLGELGKRSKPRGQSGLEGSPLRFQSPPAGRS